MRARAQQVVPVEMLEATSSLPLAAVCADVSLVLVRRGPAALAPEARARPAEHAEAAARDMRVERAVCLEAAPWEELQHRAHGGCVFHIRLPAPASGLRAECARGRTD
jgi:hypothetical protein